MKKFILAAALVALAAPAAAQNAPPANQTNTQTSEQRPVSAATKKFVTNAAITDIFEINAGRLAQEKLQNKDYKDFAQMTIDDHTKTTDQLKSMAPKLQGVQLPRDLDDAHKKKIDKLNSLNGSAFERQYRTDQVQGHEQAIRMFQNYAKSGDNTELKTWAQETLPTLRKHLQHAENLPQPGGAPTVGSGSRRH
jgi:putative membrane protein